MRDRRTPGTLGATPSHDPVTTNPDHYKVVFENDRVRVLEYTDVPGDRRRLHTSIPTA